VSVALLAGHACLVVADNGPGVPPERLRELGQRFNRIGRQDGSGVGREQYGGTLDFSQGLDGRGLSVSVHFPVAR
jgi:signal transduction histidine kinase